MIDYYSLSIPVRSKLKYHGMPARTAKIKTTVDRELGEPFKPSYITLIQSATYSNTLGNNLVVSYRFLSMSYVTYIYKCV